MVYIDGYPEEVFLSIPIFNWKKMNSLSVFLFQKMIPFGWFFLLSISALFFSLVDFFSKVFSRTQIDKLSQSNNPIPNEESKPDAIELKGEVIEEKESPKFFFKFQFQTQSFEESYNVGLELESTPSTGTSTNEQEFKSGNDFSCIMGNQEDLDFCVEELYNDSNNGFFSEEEFVERNLKDEAVPEEKVAEKTLVEAKQSEEADMVLITSSSPDNMRNFISLASDFEEDFEVDPVRNISRDEGELEELRKLEESEKQNEDSKLEELGGNNNRSENTLANSQMSNLDHSFASDSEDSSNGLETLWEHQDLIELLKMELKKVRSIGLLPTILEEPESPKIMDDLKPGKIDDKFHHSDSMIDLHKFYKSYRERMRKFDILNYQKMYAIGFLQSKDPLQSISTHKSPSSLAISSLLSRNLRLGRRKKPDLLDPMTKFIKELHIDLEMVYVGQLCLSWEILHWQYDKAIEIWESDPYGICRYNEVAGEFQQFQVLMQRFLENEPFEGPRLQNYIKNRYVLRNLLQVPVIREDSTKDKGKARRKGRDDGDAITSDMLVEIIEESIRIFWQFIRADKDANVVMKKTWKGTQVEPLEPADIALLAEVQASLQKKDRKLKDMLRSGNCILRKFKKNQEENSDQVLYFFSQVDLKLVARVLNMSKVTRDQLFWCHSKLTKINFVNRKIIVEPSLLLFPC